MFGLNAQKHFVSLYVGDIDKIEDADTLLKPFNTGRDAFASASLLTWRKLGLRSSSKQLSPVEERQGYLLLSWCVLCHKQDKGDMP